MIKDIEESNEKFNFKFSYEMHQFIIKQTQKYHDMIVKIDQKTDPNAWVHFPEKTHVYLVSEKQLQEYR